MSDAATKTRTVSSSPTRAAFRQLLRSRQARAGMACLGLVLAVGLLAPVLTAIEGQTPTTFDYAAIDASGGGVPYGAFGGISADHWLGVEPITGRDLFALIAYGIRTSVGIAAGATALALTFGVLFGLAMGYLGGWFETIGSRFVDFMFGFPSLLFLIAIQLVVPPEFPRPLLIMLSLAFFGWVGTARLIHGQSKVISSREFVTAARASGTPVWKILTGEILPNLIGTVVVLVALHFPGNVGIGAGLSFLGIGVGPETPELGRLIGQSITWTYTGADVWYLIFPGAALFLLVLGSTLLGDALRDAFDVKLQGSAE